MMFGALPQSFFEIFIPVVNKSNVSSFVIKFKKNEEKFFQLPLILFYSGNGGELFKLKNFFFFFFLNNGISHFLITL